MANPLFNALGGNAPAPVNNAMEDIVNIMSQLRQFQNSFHGNAQQVVIGLMNSGDMSQAKYNQLRQRAYQIMGDMRKFSTFIPRGLM